MLAGAVVLSWPGEIRFAGAWPALAVLGACFCWGIANNLTRKVSLSDAGWIACVKGLVAGCANLALAAGVGFDWPAVGQIGAAMLLGFLAYGGSLALFVLGLRHLGTARTGAYFSVAPFIGAMLALAMGEPLTLRLAMAALLMAIGIALHLSEQHAHPHMHEVQEHEHEHAHDEHHQHEHAEPVVPGTRHRHWHRHEALSHSHAHFPDMHHQHEH